MSATDNYFSVFIFALNSASVYSTSSRYQYLVPRTDSIAGPSSRWRLPFRYQNLHPLANSAAGPPRPGQQAVQIPFFIAICRFNRRAVFTMEVTIQIPFFIVIIVELNFVRKHFISPCCLIEEYIISRHN